MAFGMIRNANGPVWPLANAALESDLLELCALFDAGIDELSESNIEKCEPSGDLSESPTTHEALGEPAVAALGADSCDAAKLYAHLTRRNYIGLLTDQKAMDSMGRVRVVVGTFHDWSPDLMRWLTMPRPGRDQPGLIIAADPISLLRQVALRSAAWFVSAGAVPVRRRVAVLSEFNHGMLTDGRDVIIGRLATQDEIMTVLRAAPSGTGATLLSLVVHSDGIDAKFSSTVTLCPLLGKRGDAAYLKYDRLRCVHTGHCYRANRPIPKALEENRLISPAALRAAVVFVDACTVLPLTEERISPVDSIAARLIDDACTGVILCNTETIVGDVARNALLATHLSAGKTVGEAATLFNRVSPHQPTSRRVIVIGDPDVRFAPDDGLAEIVAAAVSTGNPAEAEGTPFGDVAFTRYLISRANPSTARPPALRRWHAAVESFERSLFDCARVPAPAMSVRQRKLAYVAATAQARSFAADATRFPHELWLGSAWLAEAPAEACHGCGAACNVISARFAHSVGRRTFGLCPVCNACADTPEGASVEFAWLGGWRFRLAASYGDYPTRAVLFLHAPFPEGRRIWHWPVDRNRILKPEFEPPLERPPYAWMLGVYVSWGMQFAFRLRTVPPALWEKPAEAIRPTGLW